MLSYLHNMLDVFSSKRKGLSVRNHLKEALSAYLKKTIHVYLNEIITLKTTFRQSSHERFPVTYNCNLSLLIWSSKHSLKSKEQVRRLSVYTCRPMWTSFQLQKCYTLCRKGDTSVFRFQRLSMLICLFCTT